MTFLNPVLLFGLLAVGLPVAIHILSRPRLQRVQWAAMRFLISSVQKNRRRLQMEDLILLLQRALLVALLVVIFARPALLTDAAPDVGGLAAPAVILLDNSASMGQSDGVQSRFDQAKSMANDLLSRLEPGSACALFLVSDHVTVAIPKPTADFAILRHALAEAPLTDDGSDLQPGIKSAIDLLKSSSGAHREIFIFTDSQKAAWRQLDKIRDLQTANKDIAINIVTVGDHGEDNLAITALQVPGTVAAVNQPLHCPIRVSNWSHSPAQNIHVKLATDDGPPQDEGVIERIDPGASRSVTLTARLHQPGYHSLTASIPGDRLPFDNKRSAALLVIDKVNVLIVEGTRNPDPTERDGFFLRHALVPVSPGEADQYYVKITTGQTDALENSALDKFQLIFLSNVAQLSVQGADNLRRYVTKGGAVVIFPGPDSNPAYYNADPNFSTLLPAKVGMPQGPPNDQPFLAWQSSNYDHPITALWNEANAGTLRSVRVTRYLPMVLKSEGAPDSPPPQVVVRYTDGEPAVAEQTVGKGKVVLFSSSATTAWTTLPIHPAFVPLLIRTTAFAMNNLGGTLNILPGQSFSAAVDSSLEGRAVSVLRPGEKQRRSAGEVQPGDTSAVLRYSDTDQTGPYQLFIGSEDSPRAVFAVQGDPDESNLEQESKADLESIIRARSAITGTTTAVTAAAPIASAHRVAGRELWFPFALAALLLAVTETILAHRFSQSK